MDDQRKRHAASDMASPSAKRSKVAGAGSSKISFAQRMMAKMGHKQGEGLGKEGSGIVNPIEVKLRPQGAGVGAVKEKTPQAKAEARRAAERRGEQYEDSSEEERKASRQRKDSRRSGVQPAGGRSAARPKQKVRTVAEIEAEYGLQVPDIFKAFIDHTGAQPKQLTSSDGLRMSSAAVIQKESENEKLARNARIELDAFTDAWRELKNRYKYADMQKDQARRDLKLQQDEQAVLQDLAASIQSMARLEISDTLSSSSTSLEDRLGSLASEFEQLVSANLERLPRESAVEIAVASFMPLLKQSFMDWHPLETPCSAVPYLRRLRKSLDRLSSEKENGQILEVDVDSLDASSKTLDPYESFMFSVWLPKLRTTVITDWEVYDPAPLLALLEEWKDIIPGFVYSIVVNQLVVQRLQSGLRSWRPKAASREHKKHPSPHVWIFPWLAHLDEYHMDPRSSSGLLSEIKSKYRSAMDSYDPSKGLLEGITEWHAVKSLQSDLDKDLQTRLLPRLAQYLRENFEVDPADQDITPIESILKWQAFFKPEKFGRLLLDAFFPKWINVLHLWLTAEPNYEEVGEWFTWWQGVFPEKLNAEPAVASEWEKGLEMMNTAMELGPERVKTDLAAPEATNNPPTVEDEAPAAKPSQTRPAQDTVQDTATMRDVLEEICEQENLLLVPLRKAHPETGLPMIRITANATGSGGVVVYIKGDVVWAQDKRDRALWEPIDVFAEGSLARLAASK